MRARIIESSTGLHGRIVLESAEGIMSADDVYMLRPGVVVDVATDQMIADRHNHDPSVCDECDETFQAGIYEGHHDHDSVYCLACNEIFRNGIHEGQRQQKERNHTK